MPIPYILALLAIILFGVLIAMTRESLALYRDLRQERDQRTRWAQLLASAQIWEARRRKNAARLYEESKIRRLRTGTK